MEKDPSAFYDVNQFDKACEALKMYMQIRGESILRQLDGRLSTFSNEQSLEEMADASMLRLDDMQ